MLLLVLCTVTSVYAQQNSKPATATGSVWIDLFLGTDGGLVYPQYSWRIQTKIGKFTGFGFVEKVPGKALFTNHVNTFTPKFSSKFSVRTEVGGTILQSRYFFQIGPQANLQEVIPPVKKILRRLIIAQLPKLAGRRPPNTLIAFATRDFAVTKSITVAIEGYHRFFPGKRPDHSEYWILAHPKRTKHFSFGSFILQDGKRVSITFGTRISL